MDKKARIKGKDISYQSVYRNVKHPRLEFKTGNLLLIIPRNWKETEEDLINKHQRWIYNKHVLISTALKDGRRKRLIKNRDLDLFKDYVREKVNVYLERLNSRLNRISFRTMKTKWASCSSSKNISINNILRFLPNDVIDYIIFHEVAHLKEWKHNKRFWNIVSREFKNTNKKEKDLMAYWFLLQK